MTRLLVIFSLMLTLVGCYGPVSQQGALELEQGHHDHEAYCHAYAQQMKHDNDELLLFNDCMEHEADCPYCVINHGY